MGYIRGSHRWRDAKGTPGRARGEPFVVFQPKNLVTNQATQPLRDWFPEDMPPLPDIESHEANYDIVYHEARPGDVVIHHVNTIHGSAGNTSLERNRRAASIRYIGDDVVYEPNKAGPSLGFRAYEAPTKDSAMAQGVEKHMDERPTSFGTVPKLVKTGASFPDLKDGDPLEGQLYPQVWPRPAAKL